MNGYSKMKIIGTATKSRSMDFSSDLLSSPPQSSSPPSVPQNPKSTSSATTTPNPVAKFQEITNHQIIIRNPNKRKSPQDSSFSDQQEYSEDYHHHHPQECNGGERFGHLKLSRNSSVSSASAVVQSAVKRAFSMRRSASVSERYRRIHDQSVTLSSPIDDYHEDGFGMEGTRSVKKKHSRGKILKACKRFLGL